MGEEGGQSLFRHDSGEEAKGFVRLRRRVCYVLIFFYFSIFSLFGLDLRSLGPRFKMNLEGTTRQRAKRGKQRGKGGWIRTEDGEE